MTSGDLVRLPDVRFDFSPIVRTSTREMGEAGWNMRFSQKKLGWATARYSRAKVQFYSPDGNGQNSLNVRILKGHTTFHETVDDVWESLRTRAYVGNLNNAFQGITKGLMETHAREEMDLLLTRLKNKEDMIGELRSLLRKRLDEVEELKIQLKSAESRDEVSLLKKFNEERISNLEPKFITSLVPEPTDDTIRLVVDNTSQAYVDGVIEDLLAEAS